jgi:cytidine deaminase
VGAALLTRAGEVYVGCNVENATYGATICAERSAVSAMVAAGDSDPIACAVVTGGPEPGKGTRATGPGAPCGICRQVLAEFALDMRIMMVAVDAKGAITKSRGARLAALLPQAFRLVK